MKIIGILFFLLVAENGFASGASPLKAKMKENQFKKYDAKDKIAEYKTVESTLKHNGSSFHVKMRSSELQRNKCELCHDGLDVKKSNKSKTHDNIRLVHASNQGMTCLTCHKAKNVRMLKNVNNNGDVAIDHAYMSCQGCHFNQAKDWVGGAHGKRVHIWANPRVVYNCTECHNPHDPTFKKRWPKIISTLPEKK